MARKLLRQLCTVCCHDRCKKSHTVVTTAITLYV
jgi:hypothetical protein